MSFSEEYAKLRKKRLGEEEKKIDSGSSFSERYAALKKKREEEEEEKPSSSLTQSTQMTAEDALNLWRSALNALDTAETDAQKQAIGDSLKSMLGDNIPDRNSIKVVEDNSGVFKSSSLWDDGYQFGDITRTIGSSANDLGVSFLEGVSQPVEGLTDLLLHGTAELIDLFGGDEAADALRDWTSVNHVQKAAQWYRDFTGKGDESALGDFSRNIGSGLGQIADMILLGELGAAAGWGSKAIGAANTGFLGLSSMGSGIGEALQGGASKGEAWGYGALQGAVEAGSEMIFGGLGKGLKVLGLGKGLSSIDDQIAKKISSGISNKFFKSLTQAGVKASAEGLEEVLAGIGTAAAKKLTYLSEEEFGQLLEDENLWESFLSGAIVSGIAQMGDVANSTQTGRDMITGLTKNEQAVVDKVYEKELANLTEQQEKVTGREKSKLYDDIIERMEKGQLNTDDIESVLGGEDYKAYKETLDKETVLEDKKKALQEEQMRLREERQKLAEEYTPLNNKAWNERSGEEYDRMDEIDQRIEEIKNRNTEIKTELMDIDAKLNDETAQGQKKSQKAQLSQKVYEMSKSDRLVESYLENVRKTKKYEADLSKYSKKQKEFVQKAVDSGVLNNSNTTHELVDFLAKIHELKGIDYNFTNNKKLAESGFALKDATVNGFVSDKGITLNVESKKALNSVIGHEVAHVMEGSQMYDALAEVVETYAKTKGEFDTRLAQIKKLYTGKEGYTGTDADAKFRKEVVADLVGDYIFTDKAFVQNLSTNRNVFQKIYDEIKYLYNVATAGSEQKRQLEKAKMIFAQVWRDTKNTTAEGGTKYSIESLPDGRKYVKADRQVIFGNDPDTWSEQVESYINGKIRNGENITLVAEDGDELVLTADTAGKIASNKTNYGTTMDDAEFYVKANAGVHIDELAQVSINDNPNKQPKADKGGRHGAFAEGGWTYRTAYFHDFDGKYYRLKISAAKGADGNVVYNIGNIEERSFPKVIGSSTKDGGALNGKASFEANVTQEAPGVNPQNAPTEQQNEKGLNREQELIFSLSNDTKYADAGIAMNKNNGYVAEDVMEAQKLMRERVANRLREMSEKGVALPEDMEGKTDIANSSYDVTEENTTICPRSLSSEAFVDAVSEYIGRPLTVEEQIYISQDLQGRSMTPECTYCYVATDRKAYRAFLGEYVKQRDAVIEELKIAPNADTSRSGELYKEFLNGRKDTSPMYNRFKMWVDAYKNGTPMINASHLANMSKLMGDLNEFGAELKPQIEDAMKYAQSASWAKKRVNYVAYNGHILKWKQDRINKLNSHYGLRMYSFSDFHPAFVLENMQMISDASVRGLKMLGYTKDIDFVEIFAPTGMNINVSTFGFESGGNVYENNIIGAEWEKAKALREQYPNVGITFVATNDATVNWALEQEWIDVVIPYHLVRTGAEVAKAFNYTNYTSESSDVKDAGWKKGDKKYIAPTEHNNDKATYLEALAKNHLKPRFERFIDNPNYMKLVNECRQSASESQPVQPKFNEEAIDRTLARLEANGYYQPIGGSVERMYEIAAEVAEDMKQKLAPTMSLSETGTEDIAPIGWNVRGEDVAFDAPMATTSEAVEGSVSKEISGEEIDPVAKKKIKESVGAAPSGFDPVSHLQYEYGTIPEGEHPVRDDSLPKSTNGKDKVSRTARTVKGAEATPDELVDLLDKETVGGRFSYIPIKNSKTVEKAYQNIVDQGWESAKGEWTERVRRGEVSADLTATGALLLNNAAKAGDRKAWLEVLHDYQLMGTNAGQAVQAMRILKTLSPDDSLYMIERSVDQMVRDMKLGTDIVLDKKLKQNYLDAKNDAERDNARKALAQNIASQIPSTAVDKWTALRYLNMLGNLRTQGRNIFGNVGMSVTSSVKNTVATALETIAEKASGGKFKRTKSFAVGRDLLKAARNDFANVETVALNGGKFNDPNAKTIQFQQEIQDARKIFKFAPMEKYRRATNFAMDKGDLVFSRAAYGRALAGYLKANGITETDFSKINQQVLDEARAYAVKQAQEQTFRDNNWLSNWVSKMGRRADTPKIGKLISEGVMPFRKTPANILLRAEEYSPLGLINATVKSVQAAKGINEVTGADAVNSWAKALTGTGLLALGMLLNNSGMLSGGPDEDEDKDWFESQYGWQNYAIQIGDYNFTIDFLSPSAMPLLMGAQLNEMRQNGGIELKDLESALLSLADPMVEMSMLQGVNDTLDNIRYAESNMGQFLINSAVSYLTQGLTNSMLGQLERSFEGQRMTTYVDKDSGVPAWLQKALGKASAKIPGWDYQQMPYVDAWGETEDIAPLPGLLENTLSPSYIDQGVSDFVYEELNRLNDAQSDINVYPQTPDKTITFDDADGNRHEDYNLSAEEYEQLATLQGTLQKALVEQILSNESYDDLSDKQKAKAVQLAYKYAKEYSRQEILNSDGFSSKWMAEAEDIVTAIIAHTSEELTFAYDSPGKYSVAVAVGGYEKYTGYKDSLNDIKSDKNANGDSISGSRKKKVVEYINSLDASFGEKIILFKSEYPSDDRYNRQIVEYLNSREDLSAEDIRTILTELDFTVDEEGYVTWD